MSGHPTGDVHNLGMFKISNLKKERGETKAVHGFLQERHSLTLKLKKVVASIEVCNSQSTCSTSNTASFDCRLQVVLGTNGRVLSVPTDYKSLHYYISELDRSIDMKATVQRHCMYENNHLHTHNLSNKDITHTWCVVQECNG